MNYAVVIGIDHYETKPLAAAVSDAKDFAAWLINKKLVPDKPENIKVLLSETNNQIANNLDIDKAVDEIIKDAKTHRAESNRLYFYFAGHGIGVTYDVTALCLRFWPNWFNHCISSLDYKTWFINKGVFDEIFIFLDCCREFDQLINAASPSPDWKLPIGNKSPKILICNSTMYGKLSYEVSLDKKRGAFTSFLIQSLNGDADINNTGKITTGDLKNHINRNFETYSSQLGKFQKGDASTQGTNGDNIVICDVENLKSMHNYEITFKRSSNVTLKGRDGNSLKTGDVVDGEKWCFKLEQGLNLLLDNVSGEKKLIENYSANTMSYVEF
jgi:hypothetical protein